MREYDAAAAPYRSRSNSAGRPLGPIAGARARPRRASVLVEVNSQTALGQARQIEGRRHYTRLKAFARGARTPTERLLLSRCFSRLKVHSLDAKHLSHL